MSLNFFSNTINYHWRKNTGLPDCLWYVQIIWYTVFTKDNALMAYQIAFDMYDSATQQFLLRVQNALRSTVPLPEVESKKSADEKEDSNADEGKEKWVFLLLLKISWWREFKQFKFTLLIIRVIKSENILRVYLFRYVEFEGEKNYKIFKSLQQSKF